MQDIKGAVSKALLSAKGGWNAIRKYLLIGDQCEEPEVLILSYKFYLPTVGHIAYSARKAVQKSSSQTSGH